MIVAGILLFVLLVIVHEYGHFLAAKRSGVEVEEFGFGFPPRLFAKRFGESKTLYSFNLIPLGGFVKLKGESNEDKRPHSFGAARFSRKVRILLAGVGMNVVAAFVLLTYLALTGLPTLIPGQWQFGADRHRQSQRVVIAAVDPSSAAGRIGLERSDQIVSINGQAISSADQLSQYTHGHPGATVQIEFNHAGQMVSKPATLDNSNGQGHLGVLPFDDTKTRYTWAAPIVAAGLTFQLVWLTLSGLWHLVIGLFSQGTSSPAVQDAVGPVGVYALLQTAGQLGFGYVIFLIVTISVSLAVVNVLPLPALDGGRLALISLFRLLKKPLNQKLETAIHTAGFVALLALAVLISIFDVKRFF